MTPECDHYVIRRRGEMVCRDCRMRILFTTDGPVWVEPLSPSERASLRWGRGSRY